MRTGLPVFSVVTPRKCGFRGEIDLIFYEHFHREIFSEYREIYDITPSKKGLCSRSMKVKWEICVGRTVLTNIYIYTCIKILAKEN